MSANRYYRRACQLALQARDEGLPARAVLDDRQGWICVVQPPGRDRYIIRDAYDIKWANIDVDATAVAA